MRFVISLFALIILTGFLLADDKARAKASWQWATSCQVAIAKTEVKQAIKTEGNPPEAKEVQTETISYGTCSNGSCSTTTSSRFSLFRRRR